MFNKFQTKPLRKAERYDSVASKIAPDIQPPIAMPASVDDSTKPTRLPASGMIDLLKLLGRLLVGLFRSRAAREAEMAFLRQQLVVLQRSAPARLRLRTADRLIFVWLYRLFPSLREAAVVVSSQVS
jgi:hypothetical protein